MSVDTVTVELASNNGVGCIGVVALSGVSLEFHSSGRTYGGGQSRFYIPIYTVLLLIMPNVGICFDNPKVMKRIVVILRRELILACFITLFAVLMAANS